MAVKPRQLNEYLPDDWQLIPAGNGVKLLAPDAEIAHLFSEGAKPFLQRSADVLGVIEVLWEGCAEPIRIRSSVQQSQTTVSSYAPSRIASDATYEAVTDFVAGQKQAGMIVTITSMTADKCLMVNDLQVFDRGGNWTGDDWIGLDFKRLWRDSFLPGRTNYYGDLVDRIAVEKFIPGFYYHIRRPSGALADYSSSYHFVESFLQVPVRIAVSTPGDWSIIESSPDGSERAS